MASKRFKLESLSRVIQQVDRAPDMETALRVLVERTRELMATDVCSVYFTEYATRRHVMVATSGLEPKVLGHVQFDFGKAPTPSTWILPPNPWIRASLSNPAPGATTGFSACRLPIVVRCWACWSCGSERCAALATPTPRS